MALDKIEKIKRFRIFLMVGFYIFEILLAIFIGIFTSIFNWFSISLTINLFITAYLYFKFKRNGNLKNFTIDKILELLANGAVSISLSAIYDMTQNSIRRHLLSMYRYRELYGLYGIYP